MESRGTITVGKVMGLFNDHFKAASRREWLKSFIVWVLEVSLVMMSESLQHSSIEQKVYESRLQNFEIEMAITITPSWWRTN